MRNFLWRILAFILSRDPLRNYLLHWAKRTPYSHITARGSGDVYMRRYWLFNAYPPRWPWLPSIRVHHILRPDDDLHLHHHPWDARTIILWGGYTEQMPFDPIDQWMSGHVRVIDVPTDGPFGPWEKRSRFIRKRGYTGALSHDSFHRIERIMPGGAITLFFTWGGSRGWGFKVGDRVVPWREYLGVDKG